MRKKITLAIVILIAFLLQSTVLHRFLFYYFSPNLVLSIIVCLSFLQGGKTGMWYGFLSGLLIDLLGGGPFGIHMLIYTWIGFLSGKSYQLFFEDDLKIPLSLVFFSDLFYGLIYYILVLIPTGKFGMYFSKVILPEVISTVVMTVLIYKLMFWLSSRLSVFELEEQQSPWLRK